MLNLYLSWTNYIVEVWQPLPIYVCCLQRHVQLYLNYVFYLKYIFLFQTVPTEYLFTSCQLPLTCYPISSVFILDYPSMIQQRCLLYFHNGHLQVQLIICVDLFYFAFCVFLAFTLCHRSPTLLRGRNMLGILIFLLFFCTNQYLYVSNMHKLFYMPKTASYTAS